MSATIYTDGNGDKGAILPIRSGFTRQFNLGLWYELVIGVVCNVTNLVDNSGSTLNDEGAFTYAPAGNIFFGLSDNYEEGVSPDFTNFLGISSSQNSGLTEISNSYNYIDLVKYIEVVNGERTEYGSTFHLDFRKGTSSPVYQYWALRFMRNNPTSGDTKVILAQGSTATATTSTLRTLMNAVPTTGGQNLTNLSGLNHFALFWPYQENRIKLHNVGVIRVA